VLDHRFLDNPLLVTGHPLHPLAIAGVVAHSFHDVDVAVGHGPVQVGRIPELEFVGLIGGKWVGG